MAEVHTGASWSPKFVLTMCNHDCQIFVIGTFPIHSTIYAWILHVKWITQPTFLQDKYGIDTHPDPCSWIAVGLLARLRKGKETNSWSDKSGNTIKFMWHVPSSVPQNQRVQRVQTPRTRISKLKKYHGVRRDVDINYYDSNFSHYLINIHIWQWSVLTTTQYVWPPLRSFDHYSNQFN